MTQVSTIELGISLAILAAVAIAAWLNGRNNPVPTGKLQRNVNQLRTDIATIRSDMSQMRKDLDAAPSAADLAVLKERIEGVHTKINGVADMAKSTDEAVVRIEQLLMDRALPRAGGRPRR